MPSFLWLGDLLQILVINTCPNHEALIGSMTVYILQLTIRCLKMTKNNPFLCTNRQLCYQLEDRVDQKGK